MLNGRKEWATVGQYGPKPMGYTRHTVGRHANGDTKADMNVAQNNGLQLRKEELIP